MWRDLLDSARNRGRGGEREAASRSGQQERHPAAEASTTPGSTSTTAGRADEENQVKPRQIRDENAPGAAASTTRNVSRETWLPPAAEAWQEPTAADTPIGAEAERAVRILHKQGQHL